MMKENKELMAEARASLSGNWGLAVGTFLVYIIIVGTLQVIPVSWTCNRTFYCWTHGSWYLYVYLEPL